jgi:hypothetical protein
LELRGRPRTQLEEYLASTILASSVWRQGCGKSNSTILKIGLARVKNFFWNRNESGFEIVAMCVAAVYAELGSKADMAVLSPSALSR